MKFKLLFVLLLTISCSASAQWYNINISNFSFKKHLRFAQIAEVKNNPLKRLTITKFTHKSIIPKLTFTGDNDFELEAAEHHMRFREYDEASYEFTDLAELYIKQNRFSEAKWYLLQSNAITRPQADDMHTITNLMDLAMVKANIGELLQSQQDLDEAHGLAMAKGWIAKVTDIEKEQQFIKINKTASSPKMELRYASDAGVIDTKVADKKTD
jgi:hypothetical protein